MKVQVLQEDFTKSLSLASRFISSHAQLPILGNILLRAQKNKLTILATNLEVSISTPIGAKLSQEGSITVPARTLLELISTLPKGSITLESEKEELKVETDNFTATITALNPNDYPQIPESIGKKAFSLPAKSFIFSLGKVIYAASIDESRPVLTGVLFSFNKKQLILVASDGFRLSQVQVKLSEEVGPQKLIIPRQILSEIVKVTGGNEKIPEIFFEIKKEDNQVVVKIGESVLSSRIIEGDFPNFEKIIPQSTNTEVLVDREDLNRGVKAASVFARDSGNIVKLEIKDTLQILAEGKTGNQKTKIEARVEGPQISIAYNFKFINDFLENIDGDEVEIALLNSDSPGIFKDTKDPDLLHLIMPVKIQV